MYSYHKNVQITLALMKAYGIRRIVASAGTRQISFAFSALQDDFFQVYSVVDERSAAFFALGLIQTTGEPAAIVCTSGTAACNYLSAVTEAHYQHLPLLVLTSDRHHYKLNQQEDQCIPQLNLYHDMVRKVVDLPIVRDDMDDWYCGRIVNEALLELNHREPGPVHINFQVDPVYPQPGGDFNLSVAQLPKVKKIDRVMADDDDSAWVDLAKELNSKRVLLLYGQNRPCSKEEQQLANDFVDCYNVVVASEHIANRHLHYSLSTSVALTIAPWYKLKPDIVITMGGHRMADPKNSLLHNQEGVEHWHVSRDGCVSDPFHCQTKIIECRQDYFFKRLANLGETCEHTYYDEWHKMEHSRLKKLPKAEDFDFSGAYAVMRLLESLPEHALLHISNSNSIRLATYFPINPTVEVYCNRGVCGIDGSLSSYVAQSYESKRPSFMVIGDLSFFYDMNALWNYYSTANTRVMLINNGGGAILNFGAYKTVNVEGKQMNTAASHQTSAQGWVESRGFTYFSARSKEELDKAMVQFVGHSDKPMFLEIFTDMDKDIAERDRIVESYGATMAPAAKQVSKILPESMKKTLKKIIGR